MDPLIEFSLVIFLIALFFVLGVGVIPGVILGPASARTKAVIICLILIAQAAVVYGGMMIITAG